MKSIDIAFDIEFSPKPLRLGLLGCLMVLTATDLASENVTLATYYPSPSGVYTNMITTDASRLARDSGTVEIGANAPGPATCTPQPACRTRLAIMNGNVGIGTTAPGAKLSFEDLTTSVAADGITWYNPSPTTYGIHRTAGAWGSGPNYQQLKLAWDTGVVIDGGTAYGKSGTVLQPLGGRVGIGTGTTAPRTLLDVNGAVQSTLTGCVTQAYVLGVTQPCPGAAQYATYIQGFMTKYQTRPAAVPGAGSMYCCPCPTGTCPAL